MNILYITLKHVIRRFVICNYFRDFMNAVMGSRNILLFIKSMKFKQQIQLQPEVSLAETLVESWG